MRRYLPLKSIQAPLGLLFVGILVLGSLLPNAMAAEEIRFGQGLLWKVQKGGGPVSFLLGTIHSTDARLRELPPEIDSALDRSRKVAFEFLSEQEAQEDMALAVQLPRNQKLEDVIGPELFQRTVEAVSPLGVPAEGLQRFKPWALIFFLGRPPIEMIRQAQGEPAFDFWLQAEARRRGKTLAALESYAEQIEVFDGLSTAEQVAMVTDMLADYEEIEAQFNRMFRAYLKGDIGAIMKVADDFSGVSDRAAAENLHERLIGARNRTMAERVVPLLEEGLTLVAIGALHLPGEGGVLDLLEQRGYRVTRAY